MSKSSSSHHQEHFENNTSKRAKRTQKQQHEEKNWVEGGIPTTIYQNNYSNSNHNSSSSTFHRRVVRESNNRQDHYFQSEPSTNTTRRRPIPTSLNVSHSSRQSQSSSQRRVLRKHSSNNTSSKTYKYHKNEHFCWKVLKYIFLMLLIALLKKMTSWSKIFTSLHKLFFEKEYEVMMKQRREPFMVKKQYDEFHEILRHDMRHRVELNRRRRKKSDTPPRNPKFLVADSISFQNFRLSHREPKSRKKYKNQKEFCGSFTDKAASAYPNLYQNPLNDESVVVISGILSPLGFHIAHKISQECHVSKIIGIDPMLPNTVANRLYLLSLISNMYKRIPALSFPIYTSFLGIEPAVTGLDITKFLPTHIIHVTPFFGYTGGTIMEVRQNEIAMEQVLKSLVAGTRSAKKASFLYVTGVKQPHIHSMLTVLASTYNARYSISSLGLRLGRIYGPYVPKPQDGMFMLDTVYVEDAVDAIISGVQLKLPHSITFDVASGNIVSQTSHQINPIPSSSLAYNLLRWEPKTELDQGSRNTFFCKAMQVDPYDVLSTKDLELEDFYFDPLPCVSECAIENSCISSSSLDDIIDLSIEVTRGCEVVLYSSGVSSAPLETFAFTQAHDDNITSFTKLNICKILYIRDDSPILFSAHILRHLNLTSREEFHAYKHRLNGKIQIDEWLFIFVPHVTEFDGDALLKISPGKFFARSVNYAMYFELYFQVIPRKTDALFLVSQMYRRQYEQRSVKQENEDGTIEQIHLPPEPPRRAVLLAAKRKIDRSSKAIQQIIQMRLGNSPSSKSLDLQRQFYERISSIINRDHWKSIYEPTYRFQMKHFIRSNWIVHSLKKEEGRILRCDWLSEHFSWGTNEIDEISLAFVLAKNELDRKLFLQDLDDHEKSQLIEETSTDEIQSNIDKYSDRKEWQPLLNVDQWHSYRKEGINTTRQQRGLNEWLQIQRKEEEEDQIAVRIISDESMISARKKWLKSVNLKRLKREQEKGSGDDDD